MSGSFPIVGEGCVSKVPEARLQFSKSKSYLIHCWLVLVARLYAIHQLLLIKKELERIAR